MEAKFKKNYWIEFKQLLNPNKAKITNVSEIQLDYAGMIGQSDEIFYFEVTYDIGSGQVFKKDKYSPLNSKAALQAKHARNVAHMNYNRAKIVARQK